MFEREQGPALDPYFRAVYLMQIIAVLATLTSMGIAWWRGESDYSAYRLLEYSLSPLREGDPAVVGQSWMVLWLIVPSLAVSGLRGMTGVIVAPVTFRRLALAVWGVSVLSLAHFYINFGSPATDRALVGQGTIRPGFWLTVSSTVILGLLVLSEWTIRPVQRREAAFTGMDDAERIWRGEYQTCPYCGMLNEPDARTCYHCHNLLFNFARQQSDED